MKLFLESPRNAIARARGHGQRPPLPPLGRRRHGHPAAGNRLPAVVLRAALLVHGRHDREEARSVRARRKFEEWRHPTILRFGTNADYVSHGHFFIDESNGRVLRTEIDLDRKALPLPIATDFGFDETLQVIVPVEMRTPLGVAKYGSFRRFSVQTEEKIR